MDNNVLIHYRTPGSKNGTRLYQNKDGTLTYAGYMRYLGHKPGGSKSQRRRPESKADKVIEKIPNPGYDPYERPHKANPDSEHNIPFAMRTPYHRRYDAQKNIWDRFQDGVEKKWNNFKDSIRDARRKAYQYTQEAVAKFFQHTQNKALDTVQFSKDYQHLSSYVSSAFFKASEAYATALITSKRMDLINATIKMVGSNIVSGSAKFLDSIGMDDEVAKFLRKFK